MAGLFLLSFDLRRPGAGRDAHLPARLLSGLRPVPPVRYLEALAGQLGRPETDGRRERDDRRRHRRRDGGRAGGAGALFLSHLMFSAALLSSAEKLLAEACRKNLKI